jgi:hypothetical protein
MESSGRQGWRTGTGKMLADRVEVRARMRVAVEAEIRGRDSGLVHGESVEQQVIRLSRRGAEEEVRFAEETESVIGPGFADDNKRNWK